MVITDNIFIISFNFRAEAVERRYVVVQTLLNCLNLVQYFI